MRNEMIGLLVVLVGTGALFGMAGEPSVGVMLGMPPTPPLKARRPSDASLASQCSSVTAGELLVPVDESGDEAELADDLGTPFPELERSSSAVSSVSEELCVFNSPTDCILHTTEPLDVICWATEKLDLHLSVSDRDYLLFWYGKADAVLLQMHGLMWASTALGDVHFACEKRCHLVAMLLMHKKCYGHEAAYLWIYDLRDRYPMKVLSDCAEQTSLGAVIKKCYVRRKELLQKHGVNVSLPEILEKCHAALKSRACVDELERFIRDGIEKQQWFFRPAPYRSSYTVGRQIANVCSDTSVYYYAPARGTGRARDNERVQALICALMTILCRALLCDMDLRPLEVFQTLRPYVECDALFRKEGFTHVLDYVYGRIRKAVHGGC